MMGHHILIGLYNKYNDAKITRGINLSSVIIYRFRQSDTDGDISIECYDTITNKYFTIAFAIESTWFKIRLMNPITSETYWYLV